MQYAERMKLLNFELTPQQKAVQQSARQFAQTVLQETVLEDDAAGRFPEEAYKKMGEMGFVGLPFPKEYGGQGGDYLSYVLALEEISKINSSVGIAYSVCTSLYSGALINDGNEEQKKKISARSSVWKENGIILFNRTRCRF